MKYIDWLTQKLETTSARLSRCGLMSGTNSLYSSILFMNILNIINTKR